MEFDEWTPEERSAHLSVRLVDGARAVLFGNGHTFPGRISAYLPDEDLWANVGLDDIEEAPPTATMWLRGFLSRNEPRFEQDEPTSEERERWRKRCATFRRTGFWAPEESELSPPTSG